MVADGDGGIDSEGEGEMMSVLTLKWPTRSVTCRSGAT